jgi:hypothetical protein
MFYLVAKIDLYILYYHAIGDMGTTLYDGLVDSNNKKLIYQSSSVIESIQFERYNYYRIIYKPHDIFVEPEFVEVFNNKKDAIKYSELMFLL